MYPAEVGALVPVFEKSATELKLKQKLLKCKCTIQRMLWAILNKSWRQHPTKQQLYSHLTPIRKTIQVWWTRHAGHWWRSKDKLISNILLWTPSHGRANAGRPARTYLQQLCANTGCSLEDLPGVMNDRDWWRERFREICADGTTWWWWWRRCPWCNGYRRRKWTQRHEFKSWTRLIAFHIALGERYESKYSPSSYG